MTEPIIPDISTETVSALRDQYRASEARAARLALLLEAGRDLAFADPITLPAILSHCARRAALFAGFKDGRVVLGAGDGLPLIAPGADSRQVGTLVLERRGASGRLTDDEDRGALDLLARLMAAAIDRIERARERDELLEKLTSRERELERLVGKLFTSQEDERRRVAHDLHDGVAQTATALFRRLDGLKSVESISEVEALAGIAHSLVGELRGVIAGLRPTVLDDLGISAAIATLADGLQQEGYEVHFRQAGPDRWPPVIETAFFRIAQEALSNIRKHAGGVCMIDVMLSGEPEHARWQLVVRDHGLGLRKPKKTNPAMGERIGLEVMRERMMVLGGKLYVTSHADGGVEVRALLESVAP